MKYFLVEGTMKSNHPIDNSILQEHVAYSTKNAVEPGLILVSGIKHDQSGSVLLIKSESKESMEAYIAGDPLNIHGLQEYRILEIDPHYVNADSMDWLKK